MPFFFCAHSHFPFSTPHFPLPFPTSISHFHLPLPRLLPSARYPMAATLWLRVCTPSGQCQVPLLPEPLPDGAPLQCPGQQQLRHSAPGQQQLPYGAQPRRLGQQRPASNISAATAPRPASSRWRSATTPLPATNLIRRRRVLRFG